MSAFSGMLSFEVRGGREAALGVAAKTEIFIRATSLGGVESLIEHRASIKGEDPRTPQGLLRLSIGLEHPDDLIEDLAQALECRVAHRTYVDLGRSTAQPAEAAANQLRQLSRSSATCRSSAAPKNTSAADGDRKQHGQESFRHSADDHAAPKRNRTCASNSTRRQAARRPTSSLSNVLIISAGFEPPGIAAHHAVEEKEIRNRHQAGGKRQPAMPKLEMEGEEAS